MPINRVVSLTVLALALSGCLAQSRIQAKYMTHESDCRSIAQDKAAEQQSAAEAAGEKPDMAYLLGTAFSDCMHAEGWKVSTPKNPAQTAATNPPLGAPGGGGTVLAKIPADTVVAPAPVKDPVLVVPSRAYKAPTSATPAAPILGPGVQPSPAPANTTPVAPAPATVQPAAPVTPAAPATSTYQPSTYQPRAVPFGQESTVPNYGTGAGRNF